MQSRVFWGTMLVGLFIYIVIPSLKIRAQNEVVPRFESAECPLPFPPDADVQCGYLVVPEDRRQPNSRTIKLAVGIAKSRSQNPVPDPVVYLHGGPSLSMLRRVRWWPFSPFRADRDVIAVDQRGAGFSQPPLDCPELQEVPVETLTRNQTIAQISAYHTLRALECRGRLAREGINLAAYTNADSAADFEDLRKVLGYEKWNLFAWSAGTRLALTIMRDYPGGVRSAILDSIYMPPAIDYYAELIPNAARTFRLLFKACAEDQACNRSYPNLEQVFLETVDKLNASPLTFTVRHPYLGEHYSARMNGPAFVGLVYRLLYESYSIPTLPRLIYEVRSGKADALPLLLTDPLDEPKLYRVGMNHSIHCSEAAPFTSLERVNAAAVGIDPRFMGFYHWDVDVLALLTLCKAWDTRPPDPLFNQPVTSDIPTLIFAGTFDPASPPEHGRIAAQTLPNSFFYQFPTMGHFTWEYGGSCPKRMAREFLNNPAQPPDKSCMSQMEPLTFLIEDNIHTVPGLSRLTEAINARGYTFDLVGPLVFSLIVYLIWPVFQVVSFVLRRRVQTKSRQVRGLWVAHLLVVLIAALNLFLVAASLKVISDTARQHPGVIPFGVPVSAAPLFVIPFVTAILACGLLILTALAWINRYWSVACRVYYSLVILATFGILSWGLAWNLFTLA